VGGFSIEEGYAFEEVYNFFKLIFKMGRDEKEIGFEIS